ncbi:MAG: carbohydrate-binding domain-containing protein [Oscillospiraceae bacterium]|nr:carbohydrate-binding domain-containing protein [Oscillospiraceae bacterium]
MKKFRKLSIAVCCAVLAATGASDLSVSGFINKKSDRTIVVKAQTGIKGDINADGSLTAADILMFRNYMINGAELNDDQLTYADINGDGKVNILDCVLAISELLGEGTSGETTTTTPPVTTKEPEQTTTTPVTEEKTITLNGTSITTTGSGTVVSAGKVTINEPGTYTVSGTLTDGQIIVDVDKTAYPEGAVELALTGADITCTNNSPLYIASVADECVVSVKKGTTNTITDGTNYTNDDSDSGAIYSKDDLKIKGKGILNVNGNCADGIVGKDSIKIFNGNITVKAQDDGIRGKDSVKIGDSDDTDFSSLILNVTTTAGDGIKATNSTDEDKGKVIINGGTVKINSHGDAVSAEQMLYVNGGDVDLYTYTGSGNGSQSTGSTGWFGQEGNSVTTDVSAKGLKGVKGIELNGGTIVIDSTDDAVHSNGDLTVNAANITVKAGDDGVHADNILTVNDGAVINITQSYEGLEAYDIEVKGGNISVVSSDDGFNAAGGDGSGTANPGGWNPGGMSTSTGILNISGGYMYVQAGGDGVDSNGNLTVSGGTVIVCGPVRGGNGIFDIGDGGNYSFNVTGGTIFGIGTSDMFVSPTVSNGFLKGASVSLKAGDVLAVADSQGNVLSALKVPASINMTGAAVYCSPSLDTSKYSVYSGGQYSGTLDEKGYGEGGTYAGGTVVGTQGTAGGSTGFPTRPW